MEHSASVVKFMDKSRVQRIAERLQESQNILKFYYYARANGLLQPNAEEDRYYTEEQENFFWEYELQMMPKPVRALLGVVPSESLPQSNS